jgi:hypothetical protein
MIGRQAPADTNDDADDLLCSFLLMVVAADFCEKDTLESVSLLTFLISDSLRVAS